MEEADGSDSKEEGQCQSQGSRSKGPGTKHPYNKAQPCLIGYNQPVPAVQEHAEHLVPSLT